MEAARHREVIAYNEELFETLVLWVTEQVDLHTLPSKLQVFVQNKAISWTDFCVTMRFFRDSVEEQDAEIFNFDLIVFKSIIDEILKPSAWPALLAVSSSLRCTASHVDPEPLGDIESSCTRSRGVAG